MHRHGLIVRPLLTALAVVLTLVSCSEGPAERVDCRSAAAAAGAPGPILDLLERPPSEWETLERLAVRGAMEEYGLSDSCADLALAMERGREANTPSTDPLPSTIQSLSPPTIPSPVPSPTLTPAATMPIAPISAQIPFPSPAAGRTFTPDELLPMAIEDFEYASQLRIISPEIYDAISDLAWVSDGIYGRDAEPVQGLIDLGVESPFSAGALLDMAWLTDGLSDEEAWLVSSLGYLALAMPDAIEDMVRMPWIEDGITEDESWAISSLADLSPESTAAVREIASRQWFDDGVTADESLVIVSLGSISQHSGMASPFVTMPFLDTIEPSDSHALMSLDILSYEAPEVFDDILSSYMGSDGISDSEAPILALLHDVHSENPGMVSSLLSSDGPRVEQRDIDLPLAGGVRLAIVRTRGGAARSMDLLEGAVRFSENFMDVPFPTNFVLLHFADAVMPDVVAHNTGINITVHPDFDIDDGSEDALDAPLLMAHEVAHYYWGGFGEPWLDEGAAEVMAYVYDESTTGYRWYVSDIATLYPCSIPDLSALTQVTGDPPLDCIYGLGGGLFLDLYRTLGADDFHKGFRSLYLLGQNDPGEDGPGARRIHVREAFEFHPVARDEIIPRWYGDRQ